MKGRLNQAIWTLGAINAAALLAVSILHTRQGRTPMD